MADSSHSCSAHGAGTRSIVLGERLPIHTSPQCSSDYTDGKCELKQSLIPKPRSLLLSIMEKLRRKIRMFAFHTRLFILILQFVCNWVIPDHQAGLYQRDHVNHCGTDLKFSIRRTRSSGRSTQLGFQQSPTHLLDFSSTDSFGRQAFPHHEHTAEC